MRMYISPAFQPLHTQRADMRRWVCVSRGGALPGLLPCCRYPGLVSPLLPSGHRQPPCPPATAIALPSPNPVHPCRDARARRERLPHERQPLVRPSPHDAPPRAIKSGHQSRRTRASGSRIANPRIRAALQPFPCRPTNCLHGSLLCAPGMNPRCPLPRHMGQPTAEGGRIGRTRGECPRGKSVVGGATEKRRPC